ncbi:MAG: ABC transporter substrate-binding protein [bacterium]|nr:MAG: ABC transporter substrate-binding protein [bacterium]
MAKKIRLHGSLYITLPTLAILASFSLILGACATPGPAPPVLAPTAPSAEVEPPRPAEPKVAARRIPGPPELPPPPEGVPVPTAEADREELLKYQEGVRVFRQEGRSEEALDILQGFLKMHPDSAYADDAMLEQARIHLHLGDYRKSSLTIGKMLDRFPMSPLRKRAYLELQKVSLSWEKWQDCIEAGDAVLALDPMPDERSEVLNRRAVCRFGKRDFLESIRDAVESYRAAASEDTRVLAAATIEDIGQQVKRGYLDGALDGSDGMPPYGLLAVVRLERFIQDGLFQEALVELMDILVHYPDQVPPQRVSQAYAAISDRILVKSNVIGAVLPLSGPYQVYGEKALQGIQTALGLLHPLSRRSPVSFHLVVEDSGADPVMAERAVQKLIDDHQVLTIIGPLFSRTSRSAAKAVEGRGVPLISLSPDPAIPALGENVFRRALTDAQQVKMLVEMSYGRLMMRKFAFLHPDTSYGREMTQLFWDELDRRGAEVTAIESFQPGQTDFGPQIRSMVGLDRKMTPEQQALKESGVDVELEPIVDFDALFIPADFQTVGLLAPQLAFYDVTTPTLLGTDGWNSPWVVELGEQYVEGALFTGNYLPDKENSASWELAESYWLTFGEDPQPLAAQAYDAALIVRTGVESGLVRDRSSMREYLLKLEAFQAAEGLLTTQEDGDIVQRPHLLTVDSGRIVRFVQEID